MSRATAASSLIIPFQEPIALGPLDRYGIVHSGMAIAQQNGIHM
jgi:hypothetical protein